jgi:hypothetical protein
MIGKTANGRWRVRVKYQGRVVADRTFDRRTDATRWEAEQRRQLEHGDWVDPNRAKLTVAELVPAWLEHRRRTVASGRGRATSRRCNSTFYPCSAGDLLAPSAAGMSPDLQACSAKVAVPTQ